MSSEYEADMAKADTKQQEEATWPDTQPIAPAR